ncbi:MAG: hypothetical protein ABIH88_03440 [Patescibacteria group bacterium]|nr:hypothetical protein [Patescibacteria group bacterium]
MAKKKKDRKRHVWFFVIGMLLFLLTVLGAGWTAPAPENEGSGLSRYAQIFPDSEDFIQAPIYRGTWILGNVLNKWTAGPAVSDWGERDLTWSKALTKTFLFMLCSAIIFVLELRRRDKAHPY